MADQTTVSTGKVVKFEAAALFEGHFLCMKFFHAPNNDTLEQSIKPVRCSKCDFLCFFQCYDKRN